ncbi:MAG: hypothetical protein AVDCRST_MAG10-2551, partial [uncultured Acidimicrobiales bacterium]
EQVRCGSRRVRRGRREQIRRGEGHRRLLRDGAQRREQGRPGGMAELRLVLRHPAPGPYRAQPAHRRAGAHRGVDRGEVLVELGAEVGPQPAQGQGGQEGHEVGAGQEVGPVGQVGSGQEVGPRQGRPRQEDQRGQEHEVGPGQEGDQGEEV